MHLHWSALGQVVIVGAGAALAVVVVFSFGVVALSRRDTARGHGEAGRAPLAAAGLCFIACAVAVLYGIYLIVPQFHQ
ncbi:hypothetical protein OHS16_00255 [Streptomyces sp. NBC_00344]